MGHDRADPPPTEGAPPGVSPVLAPAAGRTRRLQVVAVLAVAVAVVALGLGFTGNDGTSPTPSPSGTTAAVKTSTSPAASVGPTPIPEPTPSPRPTPAVTPAVPCNQNPPPDPIQVQLLVGDTITVGGSPAAEGPLPEVTVPVGARSLLILGAEHCAIAWTLSSGTGDPANDLTLAFFDNPDLDPSIAAENRWDLAQELPQGDQTLTASFTLIDGTTASAGWRVHALGFPIPRAALMAPSGLWTGAAVGCHLRVWTAAGETAIDRCEGDVAPETEFLPVIFHVGQQATLGMAGWNVTASNVQCGALTSSRGGASFVSATDCTVIVFPPSGSEGVGVGFTLSEGPHVVRVDLSAAQGDDPANRFSASCFAAVNVLP